MPPITFSKSTISRRGPILLAIALMLPFSGCNSLFPGKEDDGEALRELLKAPDPPDLIREATVAQGLRPIQIEGVGAINGLPGTGGPANPSLYRDQLLDEMKHHDIPDPNHFLERDDTALVRVQAIIPPGARRGDSVDIRVLLPKESVASDLHDGWLLDTRLRQQLVVQSMVRKSDVMAIGMGAVLTRSDFTPGEDVTLRTAGSILGGGHVQITRKLGLILSPDFQHAKMSKALANAVNRRFFFFDGTTRRGIAKPVEDDFIEIEVHPRYRANIPRMMEVVRAIGVKPESSITQSRLTELAGKLSDPATASDAAMQLEALGESAVPTLLEGIESSNPELRFYAAEALGYLDRSEAIAPLEASAREVAAFRHLALLTLQGLDSPLAVEALQRLMNEPSLETRYGAFCAIRRRDDGKRSLAGRSKGSFHYYNVASTAPPAIVVSLREAPEIVVFGSPQSLDIPQFMMGPGGMVVKADPNGSGKLRISRFQPGKEDKRAMVDSTLTGMIDGIVSVGGGYGEVIAMLRIAKDKGYLSDQLAIDPLPAAVRIYYRDDKSDSDEEESEDDLDE